MYGFFKLFGYKNESPSGKVLRHIFVLLCDNSAGSVYRL